MKKQYYIAGAVLVVFVFMWLGGLFIERGVVNNVREQIELINKMQPVGNLSVGNISYSPFRQSLVMENIAVAPKNANLGEGNFNIAELAVSGLNVAAMYRAPSLDEKWADTLNFRDATFKSGPVTLSTKLLTIGDLRFSMDLAKLAVPQKNGFQPNQLGAGKAVAMPRNQMDMIEFVLKNISFRQFLIEGLALDVPGPEAVKFSVERYELLDVADNIVGHGNLENLLVESNELKATLKSVEVKNTFLFNNFTRFPEHLASGKFPKGESVIKGLEVRVSDPSSDVMVVVKLAEGVSSGVFDDVSDFKLSMKGFEMPVDSFKLVLDPATAKVLSNNKIDSTKFDLNLAVSFDRKKEELVLNDFTMQEVRIGQYDMNADLQLKGSMEVIKALQPVFSSFGDEMGMVGNKRRLTRAKLKPADQQKLQKLANEMKPLLVSARLHVGTDPGLEKLSFELLQAHMPDVTMEQFKEMRKEQGDTVAMLLGALQQPELQQNISKFIENFGNLEITIKPSNPVNLEELVSNMTPENVQKLNIQSTFKSN